MRGRGAPRDQRRMHGIHARRAPRDGSGWPTRGDVAGGYREDGGLACWGLRANSAGGCFQGRIAGAALDRRGGAGVVKGAGLACRLQTTQPVRRITSLWNRRHAAAGFSQTRKRTSRLQAEVVSAYPHRDVYCSPILSYGRIPLRILALSINN